VECYVNTAVSQGPKSPFEFKKRSEPLWAELIQTYCHAFGTAYCCIPNGKGSQREDGHPRVAKQSFISLPDMLKEIGKIPYRYLTYEKWKRDSHREHGVQERSILFSHGGAIEIDVLIRDAIRSGYNTYIMEKNSVILESGMWRNQRLTIHKDSIQIPSLLRELNESSTSLLSEMNQLLGEMKEKYPFDCADVLKPYLAHFLKKDCFDILNRAVSVKKGIERLGIHTVYVRANTDKESLALLVAAKHMTEAKAVCVQHASTALEGDSMSQYDTLTYDLVMSRDPITHSYLVDHMKKRKRISPKIVMSSHYLKEIRKKNLLRLRERSGSDTVVYVQKKFSDYVRCRNEYSYSLTWYFKWQQDLIKYLCQWSQFDILYKQGPGQKWANDLMLRTINKSTSSNFKISSDHFTKVLHDHDRFIMDYPSGAFFESLCSGKSVLCLYPAHFFQ